MRSLLPMLVAAGLALTACGADEPETRPVQLTAPKVTVVEEGDGPAATVRWNDDGAEQDAALVVTQGFVQRADGGESDAVTPDTRLEMPMSATVTGGGDDRSVTIELGPPFGSNAELNEDIATAEGFLVDYTGDATGRIREMNMGAPDEATPTARAGVESGLGQWTSLPIVFPEEAIGPGAVWTVENHVSGNADVRQTITYTLVSRSGDDLELDVSVAQAPAVTELEGGDGVTLRVIDSETETRDGRLSINLGRPLPVEGVIDYVTSVTYGDGDSDTRVTQETHNAIQFK